MKLFRSRGGQRVTRSAVAVGVLSLVVYGVSVGTSTASTRSHATKHASCKGPWGWCGTAKTGYLPPHEPDVNGNGKVLVGLMTAGPVTDHGYYESEATVLDNYAKAHHWAKPIIVDNVAYNNAEQTAEDLCEQHVDLVLVGESELAGFVPAASNPVCKGVPFWAYTSEGALAPSEYWYQAQDQGNPPLFVGGYAAGLWMKAHHTTKAGFVTGPDASYTEGPAKALLAGIKYALGGKGTLAFTATGDFNASGPAVLAAKSMVKAGARLIYPFLGASTFAVANVVDAAHVGAGLVSPGSQYCTSKSSDPWAGENWIISVLFDPGYYLQYALPKFEAGTMRVGVVQTFILNGGHPAPAVDPCHYMGGEKAGIVTLENNIKSGKLNINKLINEAHLQG